MKKIALLLGIALMGMSYNAVANTTVAEPVASEVVSAKPAENVEKLLKDYEKAVNDYIKAVKANSTATATTNTTAGQKNNAPKLKKQIETLNKKLQKCEGDMTPAQLKRYKTAQEKLAAIEG